jgi:environmental stress-induced protein Ves
MTKHRIDDVKTDLKDIPALVKKAMGHLEALQAHFDAKARLAAKAVAENGGPLIEDDKVEEEAPRCDAVTLLRGADLVESCWKNGGGVTREIARYPADSDGDGFLWRVSVAEVEKSGPFSRFSFIDRTMVLLSGQGMRLEERGGLTHTLSRPFDVARFDGEIEIEASLIDGPTKDFNVMLKRGCQEGSIDVWRGNGEHRLYATDVLLYCVSGTFEIVLGGNVAAEEVSNGGPFVLNETDTLWLERPWSLPCSASGSGVILAVSIRNA